MKEKIEKFEYNSNFKFPDDYVEYILNTSNLKFSRTCFKTQNGVEHILRSLLSYDENDKYYYINKFQITDSEFAHKLVPVGYLEFGDLLCYEKDTNKLVVYYHELDDYEDVSETFNDFLNSLKKN